MKGLAFFILLVAAVIFMASGKPKDKELDALKEQEIQLKIQILQHELKAYEDMEKELKSE